MSDGLVEAYKNTPVGTSSGVKVNLGADNDVTVTGTVTAVDSIVPLLVNVVDNDASLASAAVILTYDPTAGSTALVTGASCFSSTGPADSAVVSIVLVSDSESADITIGQWAFGDMAGSGVYKHLDVIMEDGDVLELEVVTTDAAETADVAIFAIEYA